MSTFLNVLLVILLILVVVLAVLYFLGRKLEKRQVEQQQALEAAGQTVSMLVIDKKKMKLKDAGLPKIVYEQTPKYMRRAKVPIVKAKIGPKVMTLIADAKVFDVLPVKTEAKVVGERYLHNRDQEHSRRSSSGCAEEEEIYGQVQKRGKRKERQKVNWRPLHWLRADGAVF